MKTTMSNPDITTLTQPRQDKVYVSYQHNNVHPKTNAKDKNGPTSNPIASSMHMGPTLAISQVYKEVCKSIYQAKSTLKIGKR